jgi:dTDP-4-dehydrorhamnose reductase
VDLRAVTLWSMFGAVDWRSLLTRDEGAYDVGAVDIRAPIPRPTAVARAAGAFAKGEPYHHPVLGDGWWKRPKRLFQWCAGDDGPPPQGRPLLITGGAGTLGQAFARIAAHRGLAFHLATRADLDIGDGKAIAALIDRVKPWAIVNAAGFVRVADAEQEIEACMAANAYGAANLARACRAAGIPLLSFSSDLVFDGLRGGACAETDPVNPTGTYGKSKAVAERLISAIGGDALIVRTSAFFGAWDRYNFAWSVIEALRQGIPLSASASEFVSPTFVPDLCHAALDLLIDGETGIWHLANQGGLSWQAFARVIAQEAGLDADLIFATEAGPVRNTALVSERGALLRPLESALAAYVRDVRSMAEEVRPALADPHSAASIIAS